MRYSQNAERQRILLQALDATTLCEIDEATRELKRWVQSHPDDLGIVDAFEQLSLMEDIARENENLAAIPDGTIPIDIKAEAAAR
jgi:hypothetical protein